MIVMLSTTKAQLNLVNTIYSTDRYKDGMLYIVLLSKLHDLKIETTSNDAFYNIFPLCETTRKFKSLMPYESGLMVQGGLRKMNASI